MYMNENERERELLSPWRVFSMPLAVLNYMVQKLMLMNGKDVLRTSKKKVKQM
jgi:hypothetical protein